MAQDHRYLRADHGRKLAEGILDAGEATFNARIERIRVGAKAHRVNTSGFGDGRIPSRTTTQVDVYFSCSGWLLVQTAPGLAALRAAAAAGSLMLRFGEGKRISGDATIDSIEIGGGYRSGPFTFSASGTFVGEITEDWDGSEA